MAARAFGGLARSTQSPSLRLDFTRCDAAIDPRITFTRASTAWRINSAGLLVPAASNVPRICFDPITLASLGLLMEEQRANLIAHSDDWSTDLFLASASTVTPAAGGLCTTRLSFTASANALSVKYNPTGNSATQYACTTRLKANSFSSCILSLRNAAQTIGIQYTVSLSTETLTDISYGSPTSKLTPSIRLVGGGEYEVTIGGVLNSGGGAETLGLYVSNPGSTAGTIDVGAGQFEAGAFATSYTPTAGSGVTRAADAAIMAGAIFGAFYNQTEGTIVVRGSALNSANGLSSQPSIVSSSDGTGNNFIEVSRIATTAQVRSRVTTAGSNVFNSINSSWPANVMRTVATSYKLNDFGACLGGGTVFTDSSGGIPACDRLTLGSTIPGSGIWNGYIQTVDYYPRKMGARELLELTA